MAEIEVIDGKIYFEGHLVARISAEAPPSVIDRFEKLLVEAEHVHNVANEYDMTVAELIAMAIEHRFID